MWVLYAILGAFLFAGMIWLLFMIIGWVAQALGWGKNKTLDAVNTALDERRAFTAHRLERQSRADERRKLQSAGKPDQ